MNRRLNLAIFIILISSPVFGFQLICPSEKYEVVTPEIRPFNGPTFSIYDFLKPKGIHGRYYLKQLCGSSHAVDVYAAGRDVAYNTTYEDQKLWVDFKLDQSGTGSMTSHQSCVSQLQSKFTSEPSELNKGKRRAIMFGVLKELYGMAEEVNHYNNCHKKGVSKKTVPVFQQGGLNAGGLKKFPSNLGFYKSRAKDRNSINKSCQSLYHVKFVNIQGQISCIGYPDVTLNEVHIYTLNKNSQYVTRMVLRQKHNFNLGKPPECPVQI